MAKASVVAAQTAEALARIEAKLDALIALLSLQQQQSAGTTSSQQQPVEDKKK